VNKVIKNLSIYLLIVLVIIAFLNIQRPKELYLNLSITASFMKM